MHKGPHQNQFSSYDEKRERAKKFFNELCSLNSLPQSKDHLCKSKLDDFHRILITLHNSAYVESKQ